MTRDEIISMALKCGIRVGERWAHATLETSGLLRFAALVAAREREECALICDAEGREWDSDAVVTLKNYAEHCAAAPRAPRLTHKPAASGLFHVRKLFDGCY